MTTKITLISRVSIVITLLLPFMLSTGMAQFTSKIIYKEDGRLTYVSDEEGNRIPDFSHAGYRGGGVPLPDAPVRITLDPGDGDDSQRIQSAINQVGAMEKDEHGIRGAVKLNPGVYNISNNIVIAHSGVVLRGSGDGTDPETETIIVAAKSIQNIVLQVGKGIVKDEEWNVQARFLNDNEKINITTDFVPVGSRSFEVEDASSFEVGDNIIVLHESTEAWLEAVDYGATDTEPPWRVNRHLDIVFNRYITEISGNKISIDVPVYNHLDRSLSQSFIYKANRDNIITESGIEDLRLVIETDGPEAETHARHALMFDGVENGWARGVTVMHFSFTGIGTVNSTFITITESRALEPHSEIRGSRRYNFNAWHHSNNILVSNVESSEARHDFISNGMASVSGLVFTNGTSYRTTSLSEGHRLWSQAILFEKITFIDPRNRTRNIMGHYNRGSGGSGHGWASVHSVAWNNDPADQYIVIEKPPTAQNYGIGNKPRVTGTGPYQHPAGYIEGTGQVPEFSSLYQTQLEERLAFGVTSDAPARLTAVPDENAENMELNWTHVSLTDSDYIIERSDDNGESFAEIAILTNGETSYTDEEISLQSYIYRVRASDERGKSAWSNTATFHVGIASFSQTFPFSGSSHTVENDEGRVLTFRWNDAKSSYDITYTWYLHEGDEESHPVASINTEESTLTLTHKEVYQILEQAGIELGATFHGKWKVKAYTAITELPSDEAYDISITRSQITGITDISEMPHEFRLEQNYPNPFNPVTSIRYALKESGFVTLTVYDVMGRKVRTLVNEVQSRGYQTVSFDASDLASGIYIYQLQAGDFTKTRHMMLVK
jgi:hypothetical protein